MKSRRKPLVIAGSVIAHAALFAVLLRAPAATPISPDLGLMTVSLYSGQTPLASLKPPSPARVPPPVTHRTKPKPPPEPTDVAPQLIDVSLSDPDPSPRDPLTDPVALSVAAAASGASGRVCQIGAWLQSALQADPQVQAALLTIPRPARSVSNALMLWQAGWIDAPEPAAAGIAAIRSAVVSGLRSAPAACRDQLVRGPELLMLTSESDTTVIAFGSGEWRWSDLLQTASNSAFFGGIRESR
ncbi:hypothetical protein [Phenylobacterium sp.]|uniref:hypothetical protein n=1 Tax=Phenylobacterium sp. TaxID=1871053 RepID=UPI00120B6CF7|nr:hypothetical protein [Phenylobacterium sp.]THD63890.1 MAG: hypothetical protein E8A49_04230 [Phenylobacterium sp.]